MHPWHRCALSNLRLYYIGSDVELINPLGGFPAPFAMHINCFVSAFILFVMFNQSVDDNAQLMNYQLIAGVQYHVSVYFPEYVMYIVFPMYVYQSWNFEFEFWIIVIILIIIIIIIIILPLILNNKTLNGYSSKFRRDSLWTA